MSCLSFLRSRGLCYNRCAISLLSSTCLCFCLEIMPEWWGVIWKFSSSGCHSQVPAASQEWEGRGYWDGSAPWAQQPVSVALWDPSTRSQPGFWQELVTIRPADSFPGWERLEDPRTPWIRYPGICESSTSSVMHRRYTEDMQQRWSTRTTRVQKTHSKHEADTRQRCRGCTADVYVRQSQWRRAERIQHTRGRGTADTNQGRSRSTARVQPYAADAQQTCSRCAAATLHLPKVEAGECFPMGKGTGQCLH